MHHTVGAVNFVSSHKGMEVWLTETTAAQPHVTTYAAMHDQMHGHMVTGPTNTDHMISAPAVRPVENFKPHDGSIEVRMLEDMPWLLQWSPVRE